MDAALSYMLAMTILGALSTIFIPGCNSSWADEVSNLDTLDASKVKQFITPLTEISSNAYTYPSQRPVTGWTLASKVQPLAPNQDAGAQAVLYEEQQGQKLVLAFRGTLTQADSCVDVLLFGEDSLSPGIRLPSRDSCNARYDSASLDYVSQAANYTRSVLGAYPGGSLLLTGHSLGAALAILVSASLSSTQVLPVVAFSSPGTRRVLQQKSLQLVAEREDQVVVFGDEWDAVMRMLWELQVGTVCSVDYDEPAPCAACSRGSTDSSCNQCIFQTHGMDQLLQKLDDGSSRLQCVRNVSDVSSSPSGSSSPRPRQVVDGNNSARLLRRIDILFFVVVGAAFFL